VRPKHLSKPHRTRLTRRSWLVQSFGSFVFYGPCKARHDDHNLAIYEAAGYTGGRADQRSAAVFTFVLCNALGPAASAILMRKLDRADGNAEPLVASPRGHRARERTQDCAPGLTWSPPTAPRPPRTPLSSAWARCLMAMSRD
jgi:hypothetical protein